MKVPLTSGLRWMGVGWWCRKCEGTWHWLNFGGWTEAAYDLLVGMCVRKANKGNGLIIIVGCVVHVTWVVRDMGPTSCPGAEDSALMAVDDDVVE